jgi:hypothetical protein
MRSRALPSEAVAFPLHVLAHIYSSLLTTPRSDKQYRVTSSLEHTVLGISDT